MYPKLGDGMHANEYFVELEQLILRHINTKEIVLYTAGGGNIYQLSMIMYMTHDHNLTCETRCPIDMLCTPLQPGNRSYQIPKVPFSHP